MKKSENLDTFMGSPPDVLTHFEGRRSTMVSAIQRLVSVESPSSDPDALGRCAAVVGDYFEEMTGATPQWHWDFERRLPHLQLDLGERPDVLLVGHFDTVHPVGTLLRSPTRLENDKLYGPGVLDMKAGVVIIAEVARYLTHNFVNPKVRIFLASDEETGSSSSSVFSNQSAVGAKIALVFESTYRAGVLKTGARGVRELRITARGRGGHAAYPEHYVNPVDAIAEVVTSAKHLHDPENGLVVSATMLEGSSASNAVPDEASVHFSIRGTSDRVLDETVKAISRLRATDDRIALSFETTVNVPAFESRGDNYAFELAQRASNLLGLVEPLGIEARGASDANRLAKIVPDALEGLGGWGSGLHDPEHEYVHASSLAPSAALASTMASLCLIERG